MKYLQRYLSLLFALVMCVGLFSITAHAEDITNDYVYVQSQVAIGDDVNNYELISYPQNGTLESKTIYYTYKPTDNMNKISRTFYVAKSDKSHLFVGGRDVTVRFENIFVKNVYREPDTTKWYTYAIVDNWTIAVYYNDGSVEYISNYECVRDNSDFYYDLTFSFKPEKDVVQLYIYGLANLNNATQFQNLKVNGKSVELALYLGEESEKNYALSIEQDTKETGLLNGILGKLTDGFNSLGEKLSNVVNSIIELPQKLWDKISDGLQSLFIPSEESITEYKSKLDTLLENRLGAVYQVVNILHNSWSGIMQADETNSINFPSATINLAGTPFTFGGYEVTIVPAGFDVLVTAIKSIVAIVCTVAFANGLRKRYDEVMGVEQ